MNKPSLIKSFYLKKEMVSKQQLKQIMIESSFCNENFYMLILSVLIICIGLDKASNTIVIGGMILTPILGDIMSLAYGLGTMNLSLLRHGAFNYFIGIIISIIVSSLYFAIVPTFSPNHEMYTMTSISYEDFVISILGGITITLGLFYKQPVIPFIAASIATTLVPPLCIIGYSISQLHPLLLTAACRMFFVNSLLIFLPCLVLCLIFARRNKTK